MWPGDHRSWFSRRFRLSFRVLRVSVSQSWILSPAILATRLLFQDCATAVIRHILILDLHPRQPSMGGGTVFARWPPFFYKMRCKAVLLALEPFFPLPAPRPGPLTSTFPKTFTLRMKVLWHCRPRLELNRKFIAHNRDVMSCLIQLYRRTQDLQTCVNPVLMRFYAR